MQTKTHTTKPDPAANQETEVALDGASCSDSVSDTPTTDAVWAIHQDFPHDEEGDPWLLCAKLERALNKFMTVTETSNEGITQMVTVEGRVKFYDRVRVVRAEAHEIILPNAKHVRP